MQDNKIEWTDHTFNPWWGCARVSQGCAHCYAETLAHRFGHDVWGPPGTTQRRQMSESYWRQPRRWNERAAARGRRERVFCASMADVFEDHPGVTSARARLINVIEQTPALDWLLLTKRPENVMGMLEPWLSHFETGGIPPNVWIGVSVEDQAAADKRIPILLKIPARIRFLSCEPLIGPVDLSPWISPCPSCGGRGVWGEGAGATCLYCEQYPQERGVQWVIAGGESGPGARPMHPAWARSIRDQCVAAGVPFLFKQWGEYQYTPYREYFVSRKVGKKAAGRLLDGRTWDEVPL